MDFNLSEKGEHLRRKIRDCVNDVLIPLEADAASFDGHENIRKPRLEEVRAKARAEGLWALQMPESRGGQGCSMVEMAACYEEMNRSIFGPVVFNSAAPDDGNMMLLEKVATPEQKERWLQPIIDGRIQSSFAMT